MTRTLSLFLLLCVLSSAQAASPKLDAALVKAVDYGNPTWIRKLVAQGADVNARNAIGQTMLERAAQGGVYETAKTLLDLGANVNSTSSYGSPLSWATGGGYLALCRLLLDHGADPNGGNDYDKPLTDAMSGLSYDEGQAVNSALGQYYVSTSVTVLPNTPAVRERVKRMLLQQQRQADEIRAHLQKKAQLEAALPNRAQKAMLILQALLDRGADVNLPLKDGETPLMAAAKAGSVEAINLLLRHGARSDARTADHRTALMFASVSAEVSRLLLDKGNDVNAKDDRGYTALIDATMGKNASVVRLLVERGADVNAKNQFGDTPLLDAETWEDPTAVRILLDHGADVTMRDKDGKTPLQLAWEYKNARLISLLQHAGAKK